VNAALPTFALYAALGAIVAWLVVTWLVGLRQGFLFVVGIGLGAVLAGVSFGFTTGWRAWIRDRDPTGFLAQFLAIALAMVVSIPLIATHEELSGAIAPLSVSLLIGAFVFGAAMQVADGCGSGTLYKAGLGNGFSLAVLPGFVFGSFLGAAHLDAWLALGSLPLGGNLQIINNNEIEFPIFRKVGISGVVFYDMGNAYNLEDRYCSGLQRKNSSISIKFDPCFRMPESLTAGLRKSVGFGFRWFSPIGPLRFEWGIPLDKQPGEDPLVFEFTIGNFF